MITVNIDNSSINEDGRYEEKHIEMDIDETKVKFFNERKSYKGLTEIKTVLIYWNERYQKMSLIDKYIEIKEKVSDFEEYIDKYNNKYLINKRLFAGTEKHEWGLFIDFIDGDGVAIELNNN